MSRLDSAGSVAPVPQSEVELVLVVDGLTKVFSGPPPVVAVQDCSFQVRRGEFVAVTGPSGSGKTTLLSLLGLLERATSGRYLLDGTDVMGLTDNERCLQRARRIGFVFQAFHLLGYRSVLENVELGLLYQGVGKAERRRRALEVIDSVGLTKRRDGLCAHLSGGEKQRVAIARALVGQPAMVLCDEPTGNLDSAHSEAVLGLLDELHKSGMTVVVVTHDPIVAGHAHRNLRMADGMLTEAVLT